ncbi:Leucine-rich repeat transmembrane protein FLRT1 [Chionoecetes opilio]|uniref:Leucine-rich repeat transmembrane protein FLRT1 n=1 Tax=Chionoecetes opilio TaxID=41210 RepID=A0A8J4YCQ4_CHIOP|nr:Leucine-rich repeat transmembrane protein FLRT1 [Chionoecetes opilio]
MPPTIQTRGWVVLTVLTMLPMLTTTLAPPADTTTPPPPLDEVVVEDSGLCGRKAPPVNSPIVELAWERNTSQVNVNCPPKLRTLFPSLPTSPPKSRKTSPTHSIATSGVGMRGVILNLTGIAQEGSGGQVLVDVEGCGCVGMAVGVPVWAEGVTFAIHGSLRLPNTWWLGSEGLREMWVRVSNGLGMEGLCEYLPPTLQTLDLSYTPLGELILEKRCSPALQRLEAIGSTLTQVSLCSPALTTLYVNGNEMSGDMDWAGCVGGLSSVMYLHASNNYLTSASTCNWPALETLELRDNWLTSLDLTTCPPRNLTSLTASKNYLTVAPSPLPPALVLLYLSHNNITELPVFSRVIQDADFSHNSLSRVGDARFRRARKLHHLNLAHNHIKEIAEKDFYGLKKLHRLDLSHNKLASIAPSSLLPLHHLRHIHLHHNHLTHLDHRDIHALSTHAHALLHNNPWACRCQMLAALVQLQSCADCKHKRVALQCKERDHLQEVTALLHTCLQAIKSTQGLQDESDEDYSEEQRDKVDDSTGAVLIVPSLVVLIAIAVSLAIGYKMYRKHRRALFNTFSPCCGWCGRCAPQGINNNNHNHHHHHQEASQLPTGELQDSDTETEM